MPTNTGPFDVLLLGSTSAGTVTGVTTGTSQPQQIRGLNATVYLRSVGTTSGGVVSLEEAHWFFDEKMYGGTWSVITTINASSFTGGAQLAYHLPSPCPYKYFRVRISSDITGGGKVDARLTAA
jgi:hypothetical protein